MTWASPIGVIHGNAFRVTAQGSIRIDAWGTTKSIAGELPTAPVEQLAVPGQPAHILLDAARDAQLVVVGVHGRGGFTGLLLGSVSHSLLHHAPCPVAVVRQSVAEAATA